jgi:hypothetical protein
VKRLRQIGISLVLAVALLVMLVAPVAAANPTVSITVTAQVVSITNSQANWTIGIVDVNAVVYFSATGAQDNSYSRITNTGSVTVDVEIQGTNFEGGTYDWTLASSAGSEQYSLYANKQATPTVYDVEVKTSNYVDITAAGGLAKDGTNDWSMKFTAPSAFNANDDGNPKSATVTLVASKH